MHKNGLKFNWEVGQPVEIFETNESLLLLKINK